MPFDLTHTELVQHPAAKAWAKLRSEPVEPAGIQRLQKKNKACVYRLERAGPSGSNIIAKRSSAERILRERTIYENVLPVLPVATVRYYGFTEEPESDSCWLFVEDAGGDAYSPLLLEHRRLAAQWLALLHTSAAHLIPATGLPGLELAYYREHLRTMCDRILNNLGNPALATDDLAVLNRVVRYCEIVASHWSEVEQLCAETPCTFIHGDFAPKNIRVRSGEAGLTLVPFDWGSAGWGPVAADLVQSASSSAPWNYWASPDLTFYRSVVQESWPDLALEHLQSLAIIGRIFRCLVCISLTAQSFATEWVEKPMRHVRMFEPQMVDAIQAAGWRTA
jgi:hypothetical protein